MLISNGVTRYGREMLVPVPFGGLSIAYDTNGLVRAKKFLLLFPRSCSCEFFSVARSNDENVTTLEFDSLILGDFLDILNVI